MRLSRPNALDWVMGNLTPDRPSDEGLLQSSAPDRIIPAVVRDGEHDNQYSIDQIKHPVRKFAQQSPPGSTFDIDHDLRSGLCLDPGESD